MKGFIYSALISTLMVGETYLFAQADFIRQEDLATGQVIDIPVVGPGEVGEASGVEDSTMEVGEDGMLVTLYGRDTLDGEPKDLDEVLVSDRPKGVVVISTGDDHIPLASGEDRRTRADELIYAELRFSEFSSTAEAPRAAKVLYFQRLGIEYAGENNRVVVGDDDDYRVISDDEQTEAAERFLHDDRNDEGEHTGVYYQGSRTYLANDILYEEKGKEKFRILAIISPEGVEPEVVTEIASATVRIWPVFHDGSIETDGARIDDIEGIKRGSIPESLEFKGLDLYPKSDTYVVITGPNGNTLLDMLIASHDGEVPQDLNYLLSSELWGDQATEDGVYKIAVMTKTPLTKEGYRDRLLKAEFELKTKIKVRGTLVGAE